MADLTASIDVAINNLQKARDEAVQGFVTSIQTELQPVQGLGGDRLAELKTMNERIETIDHLISRLNMYRRQANPRGFAAPQVFVGGEQLEG